MIGAQRPTAVVGEVARAFAPLVRVWRPTADGPRFRMCTPRGMGGECTCARAQVEAGRSLGLGRADPA